MKLPTIGYLGAYAVGDKPLVPSLFRWGRQIHATDGRNVMGPFPTELEAINTLTLVLVKRQRQRFEAGFLFCCTVGIFFLCWLLAL